MKRFEVYCPAGWAHVDLSEDARQASRAVALATTAAVPSEGRAVLAGRVAHQLETTFAGLAEGGVWSVMLPVSGPMAVAVRPTIAFAPLSLPAGTEPMDALVAMAASDPTATVIDIEPLVALRTTRVEDVTAAIGARASALVAELTGTEVAPPADAPDELEARVVARRVRYVLGDIEDPDKWADVALSLTHLDEPDQAELADAAVESFDALITTFRWRS
jgi:hypothetical protein